MIEDVQVKDLVERIGFIQISELSKFRNLSHSLFVVPNSLKQSELIDAKRTTDFYILLGLERKALELICRTNSYIIKSPGSEFISVSLDNNILPDISKFIINGNYRMEHRPYVVEVGNLYQASSNESINLVDSIVSR